MVLGGIESSSPSCPPEALLASFSLKSSFLSSSNSIFCYVNYSEVSWLKRARRSEGANDLLRKRAVVVLLAIKVNMFK